MVHYTVTKVHNNLCVLAVWLHLYKYKYVNTTISLSYTDWNLFIHHETSTEILSGYQLIWLTMLHELHLTQLRSLLGKKPI